MLNICPASGPIAFSSKGNSLELLELCEIEMKNASVWDQHRSHSGSEISVLRQICYRVRLFQMQLTVKSQSCGKTNQDFMYFSDSQKHVKQLEEFL